MSQWSWPLTFWNVRKCHNFILLDICAKCRPKYHINCLVLSKNLQQPNFILKSNWTYSVHPDGRTTGTHDASDCDYRRHGGIKINIQFSWWKWVIISFHRKQSESFTQWDYLNSQHKAVNRQKFEFANTLNVGVCTRWTHLMTKCINVVRAAFVFFMLNLSHSDSNTTVKCHSPHNSSGECSRKRVLWKLWVC